MGMKSSAVSNLVSFVSQGVLGKTTAVHWSAASSSCGGSKLKCSRVSLCGWVCTVCTLVFVILIISCWFFCENLKKTNSFHSAPEKVILDVTWFDCRAWCRAPLSYVTCGDWSRNLCLWWCKKKKKRRRKNASYLCLTCKTLYVFQ